ncbi:MAG TPA: hypothetical protein PL182_12910, partial [Pseudobdellovibrionaceae bacterium]|nr:hypothetical protein [Pseudobdellovibrionaceae bacterium]
MALMMEGSPAMGLMNSHWRVSFGVLVFFFSFASGASFAPDGPDGNDEPFRQYYLIHDPFGFRPRFESPERFFGVQGMTKAVTNLLNFDFHDKSFPSPQEPYGRRNHFGDWVDDPRDQTCYNTRAKVLIRDSTKSVVFRSNPCVVDGGEWREP